MINNNNNFYNRPWKKRKKQGELTTLPFTRIKENDRLLFVVDDYKWTLYDINRWFNAFGKVYPEVKCVLLPYSMSESHIKITSKEYTMLNNILKRWRDD